MYPKEACKVFCRLIYSFPAFIRYLSIFELRFSGIFTCSFPSVTTKFSPESMSVNMYSPVIPRLYPASVQFDSSLLKIMTIPSPFSGRSYLEAHHAACVAPGFSTG